MHKTWNKYKDDRELLFINASNCYRLDSPCALSYKVPRTRLHLLLLLRSSCLPFSLGTSWHSVYNHDNGSIYLLKNHSSFPLGWILVWFEISSLFPSSPFQPMKIFLLPCPWMTSHLWYSSLFPPIQNRTISVSNSVVSPSRSFNLDSYANTWEGPEGLCLPIHPLK